MKFTKWDKRQRIEEEYAEALSKLASRISNRLKKANNLAEVQQLLYEMLTYRPFLSFAEKQAKKMITNLFEDNARTWRTAARKSARGREIYELLNNELNGAIGAFYRAQIAANAQYISRIPENIAREVTRIIAERTVEGVPYDDIVLEIMRRLPEISQARAALIARTEIGKTNEAITQARSQQLGISWYIWRTSEDRRVRDAHRIMEGVLVNYNDPPSPEELIGMKSRGRYNAGNIYNCRCYAEPLVDLKYLSGNMVKVYTGGKIRRMTKAEFERLFLMQ